MRQDREQKLAGSSSIRVWLDSFRNACEALERAEKRAETIPELGRIVKEKSTAATEEYWRQNRDKTDAERAPFPRPRDIVEQQEIEQIIEDHALALNQLVLVRGNLRSALPVATEPELKSLIQELLKRGPEAISTRELLEAVERLLSLLLPAEKRGQGRPGLPIERKAKALEMRDSGASERECAKVLYATATPTSRQKSNVTAILDHFEKSKNIND